jgi:hypothetical protein
MTRSEVYSFHDANAREPCRGGTTLDHECARRSQALPVKGSHLRQREAVRRPPS